MDRFNARLISAISDVLLETLVKDAREQAELNRIAHELRALALGNVDELCCERISRELDKRASHKTDSKRLS